MKVALICVVALCAASVSAQFGLPSAMTPSFTTMYKTVTTVHSVLSKSPIAPFLPSPYTMAMNAWKAYSTVTGFQQSMEKAGESVMNTIKDAGAQAKLPMESINKLTEQVGQMFGQAGAQVQQAGAAVGDMVKGEAPAPAY